MGVRDIFSRVSTNPIRANRWVNRPMALRELEVTLRRLELMTIRE